MLRFLIGWVRRSPETLKFSQLRIAKKKPRSLSRRKTIKIARRVTERSNIFFKREKGRHC